jgi:murein DD-endopeptidase MepM/ murein hydrolase activator NlpD
MSREKRRGGPVLLAGLGGFALGAATVLLVIWVYGMQAPPPPAQTPRPPQTPQTPPAPQTLPPTPQTAPAPQTLPPTPTTPAAPAAPAAPTADVEELRRRRLLLPVQGLRREQLVDSFADGRGGHLHEAMDILAARSTPVLAVEDGRLAKLFFSRQGGNTIYQFDPSETYAYYYAHLERYADGIREGEALRRGQVIGYVGTSGNAPPDTPHLHFAIFRLTPDKHWWEGTAINPYLVLAAP